VRHYRKRNGGAQFQCRYRRIGATIELQVPLISVSNPEIAKTELPTATCRRAVWYERVIITLFVSHTRDSSGAGRQFELSIGIGGGNRSEQIDLDKLPIGTPTLSAKGNYWKRIQERMDGHAAKRDV